jgi:hypothetical protein
MSQYVILIQTVLTPNSIIDPFAVRVFDGHTSAPVTLYALTTSNHPPTGLSLLQNYCPVKLELLHTIHTASQTDILRQTLEIKFRHRLLHSFWYALDLNEIEFICNLNERNFSQMIGFIHKQLRKSEMSENQTRDFIAEQIAKAKAATK